MIKNSFAKNFVAVILAAGKSERMNSTFSKVLHKIYGKPMLEYVIDSVTSCGIKDIVIVTNTEERQIREQCRLPKGVRLARQSKLLGTAHALLQTQKLLGKYHGNLLVLCGDVPLLRKATLVRLMNEHRQRRAHATLLTAQKEKPFGYGRIIRSGDQIIDIVEEIDASETEKTIMEINSGIYCFSAKEIYPVLHTIKKRPTKKEYYLTDAIKKFNKKRLNVFGVSIPDSSEVLGVNTRRELALAQSVVKDRIQDTLLDRGVAIMNRATTDIYNDVQIDQDTIIYPFTVIESGAKIGKKCRIGPFAHIRGQTIIGDNSQVGNFTEIGRSRIGNNVKINHHSYLVDARIMDGSYVGAGTLTIGTKKRPGKNQETYIGKSAHIGEGVMIRPGARVSAKVVVKSGSVVEN